MESFVNRVSWVPNSHYSHNYGLIKLLLPDILHRNVEKVVCILLLFQISEREMAWFDTSPSTSFCPCGRLITVFGVYFFHYISMTKLNQLAESRSLERIVALPLTGFAARQ